MGLSPSEREPHAQGSPRSAELRCPSPFLPFGTKRVPLSLRDAGTPVAARLFPFAYSRLAEGFRLRPVSPGSVSGEVRCPRTALCPLPAPSGPPTSGELNGMRTLLPKPPPALTAGRGCPEPPQLFSIPAHLARRWVKPALKTYVEGEPCVPVCLRDCHTDTGLLKPGVGSRFTNPVTKKICELIRSRMTFVVLPFQYLPSCDGCCAALLIITYHILHI